MCAVSGETLLNLSQAFCTYVGLDGDDDTTVKERCEVTNDGRVTEHVTTTDVPYEGKEEVRFMHRIARSGLLQ